MKEKIVEILVDQLNQEIQSLKKALESSMSYATDQEFKAEDKYDTRSLEASYLASAEAKRVEELKQDLQLIQEMTLDTSNKSGDISIGALVNLELNGNQRKYFLAPTKGGTLINIEGESILVISVFSPLGSALIGLKEAEEFEIETPKETRNYKVISYF